MTQIWIEWTDERGEEASARWGGNVTNSDIDDILAYAVQAIGREPDTQTS